MYRVYFVGGSRPDYQHDYSDKTSAIMAARAFVDSNPVSPFTFCEVVSLKSDGSEDKFLCLIG